MRPAFIAAVPLLCLVTMISCNKDKTLGKSDIIGTWSLISTKYYFDDEKIVFNSLNDALYWLYEDGTMGYATPIQSSLGGMFTSLNFNEDGNLYVLGMRIANWDYSNGQIILTGGGISGPFGYLSEGNLYIDLSEQVMGYQIIKNFNYDDPTDNWTGKDSSIHELKTSYIFSK